MEEASTEESPLGDSTLTVGGEKVDRDISLSFLISVVNFSCLVSGFECLTRPRKFVNENGFFSPIMPHVEIGEKAEIFQQLRS